MSIDSDDGCNVQTASVVGQLEGFLGEHQGDSIAKVISGQDTYVVVVGSGLQGVSEEVAGRVHDEDMVFVPSENNGQCCGAGVRQSTDAVASGTSMGRVSDVWTQSVGEGSVVWAMLRPMGRIGKESASSSGGHGGAWLALNGFIAN